MAKALKPLVVVLLILSIVSLILASMLFSKRELLKARTQRLEQGVVEIAKQVRFDDVNPQHLMSLETMSAPLNQVAVAADNLYETLQNTKLDLENTRQELAVTRDELNMTKVELADARDQIDQLNTTVAQKEAELVRVNRQVDTLEQEKSSLQIQIDDMNAQLVQAEEHVRDLQDEVAALDNIIKKLGAESKEGSATKVPVGLTGNILIVNPDWNFVVLDIGSEHGLAPTAEMLVHRADKLIGKIRVSAVDQRIAIAEILTDWQKTKIKEGDDVLF